MKPASRRASRLIQYPRPKLLEFTENKTYYAKRVEVLRMQREEYMPAWRDIGDLISPMRPRFLRESNKPRRHNDIINNKATLSSSVLQSGLHSGVSSPSRPWFKLTTPDQEMSEDAEVKQYLATVSETLYTIFALSNTYLSLQTSYRDLGDYGNSCIVFDDDFEDVINGKVLSIGEYMWATDSRDNVNTLAREYAQTTMQMVEEYGLENVSRRVRDAWDRGDYDTYHEVANVIEPNVEQERGEPGMAGAAYVNVKYEIGGDAKDILSVRPWTEWRAACGRWDVRAGEVYAEGPGRTAIGDVAALQVLERRSGQAIDRGLRPSLSGPAGSTSTAQAHTPGGYVALAENANAAARVQPIYTPDQNWVAAISNEITRHERRIDEAYFADLFLRIAMDERNQRATAREIAEVHEEKLIRLGPVLERLHSETLDNVISLGYSAGLRAGLFPEAPEKVQGMQLRVKYISLLAQAQEMVGIGSIERVVGFIGQLAAVQPSALDKLNTDKTIDNYADRLGVPLGVINSNEDVGKIRGARQQAQEAQQATEASAQLATGAKVLSEAKTGDDSMLSRIMAGQS